MMIFKKRRNKYTGREEWRPQIGEHVKKEKQKVTGMKRDEGKPDFTLISRELMISLAKVREFGSNKYEKNNWKKGFEVTRSLAAALRHIFAFLSGETLDPESGLSHLGHAVASIEHAIYDMEHHPENDDREENFASKKDAKTHLDTIEKHQIEAARQQARIVKDMVQNDMQLKSYQIGELPYSAVDQNSTGKKPRFQV